jgi:hypothetical protein
MFVGKPRNLPKTDAPERLFTQPTWVNNLSGASGLTRKHYTRLESLARDKHYNLLQKFVNYSSDFYNMGPKVVVIAVTKPHWLLQSTD